MFNGPTLFLCCEVFWSIIEPSLGWDNESKWKYGMPSLKENIEGVSTIFLIMVLLKLANKLVLHQFTGPNKYTSLWIPRYRSIMSQGRGPYANNKTRMGASKWRTIVAPFYHYFLCTVQFMRRQKQAEDCNEKQFPAKSQRNIVNIFI